MLIFIVFTHLANFSVFRLTHCTDQGEIWQGGADGLLLQTKFHLDRLRDVSLQPQNLKNFEFYQYNCP